MQQIRVTLPREVATTPVIIFVTVLDTMYAVGCVNNWALLNFALKRDFCALVEVVKDSYHHQPAHKYGDCAKNDYKCAVHATLPRFATAYYSLSYAGFI
jgi:hypothetical protein